jgi:hypothetical protein
LSHWLVARTETLRRPEVSALIDAIKDRMVEMGDALLGTGAR